MLLKIVVINYLCVLYISATDSVYIIDLKANTPWTLHSQKIMAADFDLSCTETYLNDGRHVIIIVGGWLNQEGDAAWKKQAGDVQFMDLDKQEDGWAYFGPKMTPLYHALNLNIMGRSLIVWGGKASVYTALSGGPENFRIMNWETFEWGDNVLKRYGGDEEIGPAVSIPSHYFDDAACVNAKVCHPNYPCSINEVGCEDNGECVGSYCDTATNTCTAFP
jgi:hypothetical protein